MRANIYIDGARLTAEEKTLDAVEAALVKYGFTVNPGGDSFTTPYATDAKRILLVQARPVTNDVGDWHPAVVGVVIRNAFGWRFFPYVSGRKTSRKNWDFWEAAVPRWAGHPDRTESRRMDEGESIADVLKKFTEDAK